MSDTKYIVCDQTGVYDYIAEFETLEAAQARFDQYADYGFKDVHLCQVLASK